MNGKRENKKDNTIKKLLKISDKVLNFAKPISINILITYKCNFSCKHCYIEPERNGENNYLSFEDWKTVLKSFKKEGAIYLRISGGEPAIAPMFAQIYSYAWDLGYKIEIATNGYSLAYYFGLLQRKKPFLITFSLYGINNITYTKFCNIKDGAFDKLLDSVAFCKKNEIDFQFNYILTSYNSSEMQKIYELAKQEKWRISCLRNLQNDTSGGDEPVKCQATINDVIQSYYIFNDARKKVTHFENSVWIKGYKTCYSGITHFNINPYGEMYLCASCFNIKVKDGTDTKNGISEIRTQRCNYIEKDNPCSSCKLKNWCGLCSPIRDEKIRANQLNRYCKEQKFIYNTLKGDFMLSYKLKYEYSFSEVEGDFIVIPENGEDSSKALVINETTYRIMKELQSNVSVSDIVEKLSEVYNVPNSELFNDVRMVIEELNQAELIEINDK